MIQSALARFFLEVTKIALVSLSSHLTQAVKFTKMYIRQPNLLGRVCKAQLNSGKTYTFKSFGTGTGLYNTTGCPQKECSQKLDIMIILDESGSISNNNWNQMKNFSIEFVKVFGVSEDKARVGLISFATEALLRWSYQNDKQSLLNSMNGYPLLFLC